MNGDTGHPEAGEILGWLDGELRDDTAARVQAHIEACAECRAEAESLRRTEAGVSAALAQLDEPAQVPIDEARWEVRRRWAGSRSRGSRRRSVGVAAALVLVAGGLAAVMPGSPLRSLWSDSDVEVVSAGEGDVERGDDRSGVAASLSDGSLEVALEGAPAGFQVEVRIGTGDRVEVRAHPDAEFAASSGEIQVTLEGEAAGELLSVRVPPGPGEILLRAGTRFLLRWSQGRFELAEGLEAEPLSDGVRLSVPADPEARGGA